MRAGVYRHYKGGFYQVIGIAEHTETGERLVVYISLSGDHLPGPRIRCRPLDGPEGWNGFAQVRSGVDETELVERFRYVGDSIQEA